MWNVPLGMPVRAAKTEMRANPKKSGKLVFDNFYIGRISIKEIFFCGCKSPNLFTSTILG